MSSENQPQHSPLVDELAALGKNLGNALRAVLESPQRYEVEEEVREGFQTVVSEVNEALGRARSADVTKDVGEQAEKVVEAVKSSSVTHDLRDGLVRGLRSLNVELDHLVDRLNVEAEVTEPQTTEPVSTDSTVEEQASGSSGES